MAKRLSTKEAFLEVLEIPAVNKILDVSRSTVSTWKKYAAEGGITTDKMEEILLKFGATVVQEKQWKLPKPTTKGR